MRNWDFAFTGNWAAVVIVPLALAAIALAYVCYRRKKRELRPKRFALLSALRTVVIVLAALFLLKPVIRFSRTEIEEAQVAVMLDASRSMTIQDATEGLTRLEAAQRLLEGENYRMLERLAQAQSVRIFTFGEVTAELEDAESIKQVQAGQKATALGEALKEAARQVGTDGLSGIVLLSDGVSTYGQEPLEVARFLGVPIYTVALGGKMAKHGKFHDVGICALPHNLRLIVNNRATIKIRLSNFGLHKFTEAERGLELVLSQEEQRLASTRVQFPADNGSFDARVEYVPRKIGLHRLKLALPVLPNETVTQNNVRTFTVQVTDPKIRVLMVEGVVRTEYRFLRRTLESDPNVELCAVVKLRKDRFLVQGVKPGIDLSRGLPGKKEDYEKFDIVVLGDIGRGEFTDVQLEYLKGFVDGGGGLLALGGYHSFGAGGYADSPVADALPFLMGGKLDGHIEASFSPQLTPAGKQHAIFAGCAGFFTGPGRAFALDGANRVKGARPGATVLAVHPGATVDGKPMPVVAVQRYGSGRTVAFSGDTTWKWKFQFEALGADSPYYRFWRQSVRWLSGRKEQDEKDKVLVRASTDRIEYKEAQPVLVSARVLNRARDPEENATVNVEIRYPIAVARKNQRGERYTEEEAKREMTKIPLGLGQYQCTLQPPVAGIYRGTVSAFSKEGQLGKDTFEFVVGHAASEFDRVDVDELVLRAVATESGGRFHTMATADKIPDELEGRRRRIVYREEKNLWNAPFFFLLFLGCVTAEWIVRKRSALN